MLDFNSSSESIPLLGDLDRRRLHAELERIRLELQHFRQELQRALGPLGRVPAGSSAVAEMHRHLQRTQHCLGELDGALALLAEPECRGC